VAPLTDGLSAGLPRLASLRTPSAAFLSAAEWGRLPEQRWRSIRSWRGGAGSEEEECAVTDDAYNYRRFTLDEYQLDRFPGPRPGEQAVEFSARKLDGTLVRLSDFRGQTVVLEAGSVTCPQYVARIRKMNRLVRVHPDVVFAVLYVREAHPGTKIGNHHTIEDKFARARLARSLEDDERLLLVDDLHGTAHRAYGELPNFVYVIDPQQDVVFRSDWNNSASIRAVRDVLQGDSRLRELTGQARPVSPRLVLRVLRRAGRDALSDFLAAVPRLARIHGSKLVPRVIRGVRAG
jgi:hypothetical protein